jgi:hypothetical protein
MQKTVAAFPSLFGLLLLWRAPLLCNVTPKYPIQLPHHSHTPYSPANQN